MPISNLFVKHSVRLIGAHGPVGSRVYNYPVVRLSAYMCRGIPPVRYAKTQDTATHMKAPRANTQLYNHHRNPEPSTPEARLAAARVQGAQEINKFFLRGSSSFLYDARFFIGHRKYVKDGHWIRDGRFLIG